jgi:hypothetical protein
MLYVFGDVDCIGNENRVFSISCEPNRFDNVYIYVVAECRVRMGNEQLLKLKELEQ